MKTTISVKQAFYALSATFLFASCQKNEDAVSASDTSTSTIAVAATASGSVSVSGATDSVYLVQPCKAGEKRDSIAEADLPAAVSSYLTANYSAAAFSKAFALKNSASVVTGYVVVIYYNDKPVGLQFDSAGNFVKVLEQREKGDLKGSGWHHGGRFENRDGKGKDSVALTALSSSITSYFATNYAGDTLVKALKNRDSSIIVVSKNNGLFASVFKADGSFVGRSPLPSKPGAPQSIELSELPSVAANYLSQTYPNYVYEKAFAISQGGSIKGYVVLIDANNTKYAVAFDANGSFVAVKVIR